MIVKPVLPDISEIRKVKLHTPKSYQQDISQQPQDSQLLIHLMWELPKELV